MTNTREVMNDLISTSFVPFTVMGLRDSIALCVTEGVDVKAATLKFLYEKLKDLVSAINLPLLSDICIAIKKNSTAKMDIDEIKISPDPKLEEVSVLLRTVHQYAQKLQTQKEEVMHFISIFNSAKGYITSFKNATDLILRDVIEGRKELKSTRDAFFNDLEVYETFLKGQMKDLNTILDEVLSGRTNLCMRLESSVRLLEKFRPMDERYRNFSPQTV